MMKLKIKKKTSDGIGGRGQNTTEDGVGDIILERSILDTQWRWIG